MRLLFKYLRLRLPLVALALGCASCSQVFILLDPVIFRFIIDGYSARAGRSTTGQLMSWSALLLVGALAAALGGWVAKSFQLDLVNRITRGVGVQLYGDAVRHSLGMPYSAFETRQSGQLMSMIQTARHDVELFLTSLINTGFTSAVAVVFVIVYSARLNWILAPAFLLASPLLACASYLLSRGLRDVQRQIVVETSRMAGSAGESMRNIEIVKSLGLSKQEMSRVEAQSNRIFAMEVRKIRYTRYLTFFHGGCVHLLRFGLILLFLYLVYTNQITMGQFFSLFLYSYFIFSPMQEIGALMALYQEAEASLNHIESTLKAPQEIRPERATPVGPLQTLSFGNVAFQYPSSAGTTVNGISFELRRGETIAFVGPSGSGKTTLVKLLAGLYLPHAGEISYNGIPACEVDVEQLRKRIGLVTQDTQLFSGTIRDNLIFVKPEATDRDCYDAIRQAAAVNLLTRADKGLDTLVGEGGVRVSGGERQRISIARALLRNPELLIFDEATSSLDSVTEEEILRTIKAIHSQRLTMTVMIAHRLSTIRHADRIYVLNGGSIAEIGTHERLLENRGLYHGWWRQQTGGTIAQTAV